MVQKRLLTAPPKAQYLPLLSISRKEVFNFPLDRLPSGRPGTARAIKIIGGGGVYAARNSANKANSTFRREQGLTGEPVDVHEINPVKFGGSPTESAKKVIMPRDVHRQQVTSR